MKRINFWVYGGLGNQLFQIAAALTASFLVEEKIYCTYRDSSSRDTFASSNRQSFKLLQELFSNNPCIELRIQNRTNVLSLWEKANDKIQNVEDLKLFNPFDPSSLKIVLNSIKMNKRINVSGYFQIIDPLYLGIVEILRSLELRMIQYGISEQLRKVNYVLHIRRGDYLIPSFARNFGVLSDEYYFEIIDGINSEVLVISENKFEVKDIQDRYSRDRRVYFLDKSDLSFEETFRIMSQARYLYTANSTYSLWAAMLNKWSNQGEVYLPLPWSKVLPPFSQSKFEFRSRVSKFLVTDRDEVQNG